MQLSLLFFCMKQFDRRQVGDGWVGVSIMFNIDIVIEDRNKTVFDWCKDGDIKYLLYYLKIIKINVNKQDENVRKYYMLCIIVRELLVVEEIWCIDVNICNFLMEFLIFFRE